MEIVKDRHCIMNMGKPQNTVVRISHPVGGTPITHEMLYYDVYAYTGLLACPMDPTINSKGNARNFLIFLKTRIIFFSSHTVFKLLTVSMKSFVYGHRDLY